MAVGGKRSAGERVLEGRHVIGLFFLMLLFSGVFFTLGYVMGRNQYEGQVRAESTHDMNAPILPRSDASPKHSNNPVNPEPTPDATAAPSSDWEFYRAGEKKASDDHLKPVPAPKTVATSGAKPLTSSKSSGAASKLFSSVAAARGSYSLQVAALTRESDALALAANLQKRKFPAYVLSPQGDKFYRVQVGPYADQKSADAARKGLESAGFKAIVKH
jgi:cell division septation protein DedD